MQLLHSHCATYGISWRDVACQASLVGVHKSVGMVAPVVVRKPNNVIVQAAVPLLVNTSCMHTEGQMVAGATKKCSYTWVAKQAMPLPTQLRNETSVGYCTSFQGCRTLAGGNSSISCSWCPNTYFSG